MTFPVEDVIQLLPQKPPFVMVSKLLYVDEVLTRSSLYIKSDNVFVKDNVFLEGGLLENIAQTAALRAGYLAVVTNKPVALGYIGSVKNLEIFSLPKVDDELVTEIMIENQIYEVIVFSGKVWHNEKLLAQCEMNVYTGMSKTG